MHIVAYSTKAGHYVDLYYDSIQRAKSNNPTLINFREVEEEC